MEIKQVDCKISTKKVNKYNKIRDVLGQLHTKEYKATKKQVVRLQLNRNIVDEKKSKESQTRLMS